MDRPIFVMGSMGSGTTLLRLILDSHPNLAIGQETGFLRAANAQYFIPFWKAGGVWLERLGLTTEELDESVRAFYDDVFSRFADKRGAQRWGDKTPYHIWHMELAARVFPDAQFVATIRHPGAVANSLGRFKWKWDRGVRHWYRANRELAARGAQLGERFHLVRYEDLVANSEPVLREVLGFLDEPWDDSVMQHHSVQSARGATAVEGRTRADDPIDTARVAKWLAATNPKQRELLVNRTGDLAAVFGYDSAEPHPVSRLNRQDPDQWGISGDDLASYLTGPAAGAVGTGASPTFENSLYTPDALAAELRKAYEAGQSGESVRATYRKRVQGGKGAKVGQPEPPAQTGGRMAAARRRAARLLDPD